MRKLLEANFKDGVRIDGDKRKLSDRPDLLSQQIEYHNKATYSALEFYVKVLLAVLGGVAVVVFKGPLADDGRLLLLVYAAGWIVLLVTFLFCLMILVHQKLSDGYLLPNFATRGYGTKRGSLLSA
jgi:hypothetical protein